MPKYYVKSDEGVSIVDAETPLKACVKSLLLGKFVFTIINGWYWVGETGELPGPTDVKISSNIVNKELEKYFPGP